MPPLRKCPRGALDAVAAGMRAREPRLSRAQIAERLNCHVKSLAPKRCPHLARVWAMIKANRLDRTPSGLLTDRKHNGHSIPNPKGGEWVGYNDIHNVHDDDDDGDWD
jgi:hypothetical protein